MTAKTNHERTRKPRARAKANRTRRAKATVQSGSPTAVDMRRYMDWRAGISAAEIAARENKRVATIETSIERMRVYAAANSAEMSELAVRAVARETLPQAKLAIEGAFTAVRSEPVTVGYDELGNPKIDYIERPDHKTRLEAIDRIRALFASAQPKTPLLSLTNNNTVNTQNNLQAGLPGGSPTSSEAIIRQIRSERGLALPADIGPEQTTAVLVERDMELNDDLEDADDEDSEDAEEGEYDDDDTDKETPETGNLAQEAS